MIVPFLQLPTTNILEIWKITGPQFPILSRIARNILAVPIASVRVERLFSIALRLYGQQSVWSGNTFRATMILHEYDRRQQDDSPQEYLYTQDLQNPSITQEDIKWEKAMREQELKQNKWHDSEWQLLSDNEEPETGLLVS